MQVASSGPVTAAPDPAYDVVVVGAGVIGLACAWRAAGAGLRVAVVDPQPRHGASYAAAGMLAPVTEVHYGEEPLLRLGLAAAARYPGFVADLEAAAGHQVGYRRCGTLAVALDAGDRAVLEELADFQAGLGLEVQLLSGREARRLEPLLAAGVQAAVHVVGDHQVDNRRLTAALLVAAERAGAHVLRREVTEVVVTDGQVTGVRLDDGSQVGGRTVVLAAGARCATLPGLPEAARPPVRPVKGQILRLRVPPAYRPLLSRTVRGMVHGFPVYLVPREDGELVVGATMEELGYDEQVTAGGVYELLRDAYALVPAISELPLEEVRAGLRPGSPDNAPLVGTGVLPGLVVATGHHRNGVLLAPITADAVLGLLTGTGVPDPVAHFSPLRFAPAGGAVAQPEGALR